jgi:hypothetical protein
VEESKVRSLTVNCTEPATPISGVIFWQLYDKLRIQEFEVTEADFAFQNRGSAQCGRVAGMTQADVQF